MDHPIIQKTLFPFLLARPSSLVRSHTHTHKLMGEMKEQSTRKGKSEGTKLVGSESISMLCSYHFGIVAMLC